MVELTDEGYSFDGLTEEEIEASIVRYVGEIEILEDEKKDYVGGVREAIKDLKARVKAGLRALAEKRGQATGNGKK